MNGPRLTPKSGTTKQVVVFLHGYGADGNDLIDIGRAWQDVLPDAAFVSPHAPNSTPMGFGRQWFGLTNLSPDELWRGVNEASAGLNAFLDAELKAAGLTDNQLGLVGFSQGTMMALHVGLRRDPSPAAIVGFSGVLVGPENLIAARQGLGTPPPVLLTHGDQDQVIPPQALPFSAQGLNAAGVPVETHLSRGLGHGIDQTGLQLGAQFLALGFKARAR